MVRIDNTENGTVVIFQIPKINQDKFLNEKQLDEYTQRHKARQMDIIGAFSERISKSVHDRMKACEKVMLEHLPQAYSPAEGIIQWDREDGSHAYFNKGSYDVMIEIRSDLKCSNYKRILEDEWKIDQIIKAIMNDRNFDKSDSNGFHFSELVTTLCEQHKLH